MTADRLSALSPRQLECLHLVAQGYEAKEIGRRLGISDLTVKNHLSAARAALGVGRSIDAARLVAAWKGSGAPDTSAADTGAPRTSAPGGIADRSYLDDEPPRRSDPAGELRDGAHGSIGVGGLVGRSLLLPGPTRRGQRNGLGLGARLALVVLLTVLLIAAVGFFVHPPDGGGGRLIPLPPNHILHPGEGQGPDGGQSPQITIATPSGPRPSPG